MARNIYKDFWMASMFYKVCSYFILAVACICLCADVHASMPMSEDFIEVEDAKLFYRTAGKGQPLLVLHGGPGMSQEYLLPEMFRLAENHQLIFYDQRGSGRSTGEINAETMTTERFIADIEALRRAFKYDKISVLGHSWGGFLAMQYAIAHPERVDKLILSNSVPSTFEGLSAFMQEWSRRMTPFMPEMVAIQNSEGYRTGDPATIEQLHRLIFRTYCHMPEKANLLHLRASPEASINGSKVHELFSTHVLFKPFDLRPALRSLKLKALVIHGEADPIPLATAQDISESLPDCTFVVLKDCEHFPYVESSEAYFQALESFLNN